MDVLPSDCEIQSYSAVKCHFNSAYSFMYFSKIILNVQEYNTQYLIIKYHIF